MKFRLGHRSVRGPLQGYLNISSFHKNIEKKKKQRVENKFLLFFFTQFSAGFEKYFGLQQYYSSSRLLSSSIISCKTLIVSHFQVNRRPKEFRARLKIMSYQKFRYQFHRHYIIMQFAKLITFIVITCVALQINGLPLNKNSNQTGE